ncbi:MAG: hypothetical protein ACRC8Y_25955 [Chroococcales cyanobacterium]
MSPLNRYIEVGKQKPIAVVYFHPVEKGVALAMGDRRSEHPVYLFFSPNLW